MDNCPKCGAGKNKHGKWTCRSFPHREEFRQSVECRLSAAYQLIETIAAERDKLEAKLFAAESRLYDLINERNEIEKD